MPDLFGLPVTACKYLPKVVKDRHGRDVPLHGVILGAGGQITLLAGEPRMTHHDAFLRAICENPADDTPRLIYADWLDDRDDLARAELIRVQCELERLAAELEADGVRDGGGWFVLTAEVERRLDRNEDLRRRERDLLGHRRVPDWAGAAALAPGHSHWRLDDATLVLGRAAAPFKSGMEELARATFRRGFVAEVTLPLADFLARAGVLFAAHPIEAVRLSCRGPRGDTPPSGWYRREPGHDCPEPDDLPPKLWGLLPGGRASPSGFCWYDAPGAAEAALSAACVAYGRRAAKLPPLEPAPPAAVHSP